MTIAVKTKICSPHNTSRRVHTVQVVREEPGEETLLFAASNSGEDAMRKAACDIVQNIRKVADNVERELAEIGVLAIAQPPTERVLVFRAANPAALRPDELPVGHTLNGRRFDRAIVHLSMDDLANPHVQSWLRALACRRTNPETSVIQIEVTP